MFFPFLLFPGVYLFRNQFSAVSYGDLAIFAGGNELDENFQPTDLVSSEVDFFNVSSALWSETAHLSTGRSAIEVAVVRDLIFFLGGNGDIQAVDVYNVTANTWTNTSLPISVSLQWVNLENVVLFWPSFDSGTVSYVNVYYFSSGAWSTPSLPYSIYDYSLISTSELAFFAGGYNKSTSSYYGTVIVYNSTADTFSVQNLTAPRKNIFTVAVNDLLLFAGGTDGVGWFAVVDIYNLTSRTWFAASLSEARGGIAVAQVLQSACSFPWYLFFFFHPLLRSLPLLGVQYFSFFFYIVF